MLHTVRLEDKVNLDPMDIDQFVIEAAWAVCSTHHNFLGSSPGTAVFGHDMLFDFPNLANWKAIGHNHQWLVNDANDTENMKCINHDYVIGDRFLVINGGVDYHWEHWAFPYYTSTYKWYSEDSACLHN